MSSYIDAHLLCLPVVFQSACNHFFNNTCMPNRLHGHRHLYNNDLKTCRPQVLL